MQNKYFLNTGEADRLRLTILNKLYNATALNFLKQSGLQEGMTVLEIGCGTGHMACEIAQLVGPSGKVIAIDNSPEQIKIAKQTAQQANIQNIEFHICDVFDIAKLNQTYDATYGRWVIEFSQQPEKLLEIMHQNLNNGGLLTYEATNIEQDAYFSSPHHKAVEQWYTIGPNLFKSHNYPRKFSYEIYPILKKLNCKNIQLKSSQAILTTAEEKSVYRLGLLSSAHSLLENNIATETELEILSKQLGLFEQSDAISGFYRNLLISGVK